MRISKRQFPRIPRLVSLCATAALLASTLGGSLARAEPSQAGPVYGGTLRVGYPTSFASFDPAQAIGADSLFMSGTFFNGLYQFDRNGQPQLDLAAAPPTISADHKVWTFHLRKGVLFSNGMPLTANDVKYSLLRVLSPHLKPAVSWGQTGDNIFKGSQDYIDGKATDVSGIQVLDPYTIRFTLTGPFAVLPFILAETCNLIVSQAVVSKESPDQVSSQPVGTGPFILQSWQKGVQVTVVRNAHYYHKGKPYVDKIIAYTDLTSNLITLKIENGELDGFGNSGIAAADLQQVRANPNYTDYLINTPITVVSWIDLDVHVPPLDKLAFRQGVAMAINRTRLAKLTGGLSIPGYQMVVPLETQYDPALDKTAIYPYNPQKAEALIKSSGYHGQTIDLTFANDDPMDVALGAGVQQDLQSVGLKVALHSNPIHTVYLNGTSLTGHQISEADWGFDFADAYDIYTGRIACGVNGPGGGSASHYCDTQADALFNRAQALPLGTARDALIRQAMARILQSATKIPLVFSKGVMMVSPKVGGFYFEPIIGWQYENYWLEK